MTAPVLLSASGRLARDPDARKTAGGKDMTLASLAVDLPAGRDTDPETWWLSLMAFGRVAGELAKHRKSDRLAVMGNLQRTRYRTADGEERDSWTLLCDAVIGPRSPRPSGGKRNGGRSARHGDGFRPHRRPPPSEGPMPDDDLPF